MKRKTAGAIVALAIGVTGAVALAGVALTLPLAWLKWEGAAAQASAQANASVIAQAAASRAGAGLQSLLASFGRATASLRADQLGGDTVPLTAGLLRMEPLVAPATGLTIVNAAGLQVAAASVAVGAVDKPLWWTADLASLPAGQPGILGCTATPPGNSGLIEARRIADDAGKDAGAVAATLPVGALAAAARPTGPGADGLGFTLTDSAGCVLAQGAATVAAPPQLDATLLQRYRRYLPSDWGMPAATTVTAQAGNLVWTGTISPEAALALRQSEFAGSAKAVRTITGALLGFALLLACVPMAMFALLWRRAKPLQIAMDLAPAHGVAPASRADAVCIAKAGAKAGATDGAKTGAASAPVGAPKAPAIVAMETCTAKMPPRLHGAPGRIALVVGLDDAERRRMAAQLELAGLAVDTTADGFMALGLAERAAYLHGALDLMVLDATLNGPPVQDMLSRLKSRVDLDRLRIVLIAGGRVAGAFGGVPAAAAELDELVAGAMQRRTEAPPAAPAETRPSVAPLDPARDLSLEPVI